MLYNFADANELANTDTVFEGIDISSMTFGSSYYFMRNVKGVIKLSADLLSSDPQTGQYFTGHLGQEYYFLLGFDAAF